MNTPLSSSCSPGALPWFMWMSCIPSLVPNSVSMPGFGTGVVKVRAEGDELSATGLQVAQLAADDVLQVVILARARRRQRDAGDPVEERRARVVERVRGRSRQAVEVGEAHRNRGQTVQDRMAEQWIGAMKDHQ